MIFDHDNEGEDEDFDCLPFVINGVCTIERQPHGFVNDICPYSDCTQCHFNREEEV